MAIEVEIISIEKLLWSGTAKLVSVTTIEGDMGVMEGHQPVFAALHEAGVVSITEEEGKKHIAAVTGGFVSVTPTKVAVLVDEVIWLADIDSSQSQRELSEYESGTNEHNLARAKLRALQRGEAASSGAL